MLTPDEVTRSTLAEALNTNPRTRDELAEHYGEVIDTEELKERYEVQGFLAPFCIVRRRSDGVLGSLIFQHNPRFYFAFEVKGER